MKKKKIIKKIKHRKNLLNFLLKFLAPNNKLMIILSQDLDKYISLYQLYLSKKYYRNRRRKNSYLLEIKSA